MCGSLQETIDVYGLAGEGTFGSVFLGRERNGGVANPEDLRHYAIKVEKHLTLLDALQQSFWNPPMAQVPNPHTHYQTFIPSEALVLLFLTDSDRFPTLDSVYTHDRFQAIVMSPCTDYDPDQAPQGGRDYQRQFPAFNGHYLLTETRRPLLDSRGACKVSAQFVEAVTHMADMNLWHGDISVNNFIVDKVLNVQVLDLAEVTFGLHEKEFFNRQYMFVPFQEYQMSPELASHMSTFTGDHCSGIDMGHDLRRETLWKLGVIVYGIVHGFWPWDFPLAPGSHPDLLSPSAYSSPRRIHSRRDRILNEPLRINENLPQDCRDVLQAMLSQNTEDRPTLAELEAYPWFSQWVHETQFWERPLSQAFRDSYTTQIYT
ncbi:hypothetical protein N7462_004458 [Penicillium macrosclerotiorum]|uniref:uncharacterized protein n=1 Tax=Penicillium macrosclerotiorum TaxID=303699 RepID=UPI00254952F4|nr:uncharacterized protein N7462_004458 [Penicillium macrosclerotiorum]KAJ5690066.1 hypothetical protein N7462_004458 [Penicillium macrosclerotiorum]